MTKLPQRPDFRKHLSEDKGEAMTTETNVAPNNGWQAVTALILAILGIYFLWVPILGFVLALMALIFGVWGLRAHDNKVASVAAVIVSSINLIIAILGMVVLILVCRFAGMVFDDLDAAWDDDPVLEESYWRAVEKDDMSGSIRRPSRASAVPEVGSAARAPREAEASSRRASSPRVDESARELSAPVDEFVWEGPTWWPEDQEYVIPLQVPWN